jgi:hypothetical protein
MALVLAGCAAPEKPVMYVEPEAATKPYSMLVLAEVKNNTGADVPDEILQRTAQRLANSLRESGYTVSATKPAGDAQEYLLLDAKMLRYEGGSTFGRWIGFGAGTAVCGLEVGLIDGRTGRTVGDMAATQKIEGGGLYSLGAGNYIVDHCADSVASGIAEKIAKPMSAG